MTDCSGNVIKRLLDKMNNRQPVQKSPTYISLCPTCPRDIQLTGELPAGKKGVLGVLMMALIAGWEGKAGICDRVEKLS